MKYYRCRDCHTLCAMNLDHVEGCNAKCTGTWFHPYARGCELAGNDVNHDQVFASTLRGDK